MNSVENKGVSSEAYGLPNLFCVYEISPKEELISKKANRNYNIKFSSLVFTEREIVIFYMVYHLNDTWLRYNLIINGQNRELTNVKIIRIYIYFYKYLKELLY